MLHRRKFMVAALAMFLVQMLLVNIPARADEKKARHELESIYAKVDEATKNKDIKTLRAYMAEDFSMKMEGGKVLDRNETLDAMTQSFGQLTEIQSSTTTIDHLKEENGTVVVDTTQILKATVDGPDNKSHQVIATAKSRETWIHTEHGWLVKLTESLGQSVTMDGKALAQ